MLQREGVTGDQKFAFGPPLSVAAVEVNGFPAGSDAAVDGVQSNVEAPTRTANEPSVPAVQLENRRVIVLPLAVSVLEQVAVLTRT